MKADLELGSSTLALFPIGRVLALTVPYLSRRGFSDTSGYKLNLVITAQASIYALSYVEVVRHWSREKGWNTLHYLLLQHCHKFRKPWLDQDCSHCTPASTLQVALPVRKKRTEQTI